MYINYKLCTNRGHSPAICEAFYLDIIKDQDVYGVDLYHATWLRVRHVTVIVMCARFVRR